MKKLLLTLVGVICSLGMSWAATVSDLVAIDKNLTFIFDDYTSSGTKRPGAGVLFADNHILDITGGSVATNKGTSTFAGGSHLNSLRLKNVQDRIAFKVSAACKVTFYSQSNSSRGIVISTSDRTNTSDEYLAQQPASTPVWEYDLPAAGVYYLSNYGGDFFLAGFVISGFVTADKAPTISVPTTASGDTKHPINVKATVDGSPEPTIQWYSNTTASNEGGQVISGATAATYQFNPSVAGTYYFYATATNTVGTVTSNVSTVTVSTAYAVTYEKGEDAIGTAPATFYTAADGKVTIPTNYSLSVEDKTLESWTDGVNEYLPGQQYTLTNDVSFTPNFVDNTTSLERLAATTTVKFINSSSVAVTYQSSNKNAVVEQLTENGKTIDVALVVQNGKFDLQPSGPRAQTNDGTKISIPVTDGAKVVIDIYDNKADGQRTYTATINGEPVDSYLAQENGKQRVMTYTYNGVTGYIDYVVGAGNMYAYCIDVTYPGQFEPSVPFSMKTAATGNVSIEASAVHVALPAAANLTINGGSVTVSNGQSSAKNLVTTAGFAMTNGNTFFTVTLDDALQAGDVISATMSQAERGLKFATADGYSDKYPGEAVATTAFSYTVTEGDGICGETTFNVFRATGSSTYFNNFKISRPATVTTTTLNTEGLGTFSCEYPVLISGAKVYKAEVDGNKVMCTEVDSKLVPAGEGVILEGTAGATVTALYNASATALTGNDLKPTTLSDGSLAAMESCLVLSGNTFMSYDGASFAAGKAYLPYVGTPAPMRIVFEKGEATSINAVNATANRGVMFNLAGQRISPSLTRKAGMGLKGIIVVNGKKVIR